MNYHFDYYNSVLCYVYVVVGDCWFGAGDGCFVKHDNYFAVGNNCFVGDGSYLLECVDFYVASYYY